MTILCILSFTFLKAQTIQGKFFVGISSSFSIAGTGSDLMSLGFTSYKYKSDADGFVEADPDKSFGINLLPKFGFFVINNLVIGVDLTLAFSSDKDGTDDDKYTQTLFGAGPFVRYYIPTEKIKPFFEVGGSFGVRKSKYESDSFNAKDKYSVRSFVGGIGMAVLLGDRVTFDVMGGYNSLTVKDKEDNEDNYRSVYGSFGLRIGFIVLLGAN